MQQPHRQRPLRLPLAQHGRQRAERFGAGERDDEQQRRRRQGRSAARGSRARQTMQTATTMHASFSEVDTVAEREAHDGDQRQHEPAERRARARGTCSIVSRSDGGDAQGGESAGS